MKPPFSASQFFEVFALYNEAVWPMQVILLLLGMAVAVLAVRGDRWRGRVVNFALALLWIWMALAYHVAFFREINPVAGAFAGLFLVQGAFFLWLGLHGSGLRYEFRPRLLGYLGGALVIYALLIYPVVGLATGRPYASQPTFGLPCPTTIFTIGILLWATPRVPWALLVVPAAWSVIRSTAVSAFGVFEDIVMPVAVLIAGASLLRRGRDTSESQTLA